MNRPTTQVSAQVIQLLEEVAQDQGGRANPSRPRGMLPWVRSRLVCMAGSFLGKTVLALSVARRGGENANGAARFNQKETKDFSVS